ncbi:uncharacterized protein LOC119588706 [Penaeus monodon]|uniref:uncharacterized protein LOC119588706 n=1 Tax=Penaeus monodon TaxID=6687 RepID=UPI0018A798C5|nr:uncharacterized protein LOC119588706 [Penaeus monodon]
MFNLLVRRFSSAGSEDAAPADQGTKSQEDEVSKSPRGSITNINVRKLSRGSAVDQEVSPRSSIGAQVSKSSRGSFADQEVSRSPRGSIGEQVSKSPRGSFVDQEASRSPRGSVERDG